MSPMPRSRRNLGLPDNVRVRDGYYSWRHPITKKEWGLGRDKAKAFQEARAANNAIAAERSQVTLLDRISNEKTLGMWLDEYQIILSKRQLKPNTVRQNKSKLNAIREGFDCTKGIKRVSTLDVVACLNRWTEAGQMRMAVAVRSMLLDLFDEAIAAGWLSLGANPAIVSKVVGAKVKRARLTLDDFKAIYAAAKDEPAWVQRSMELAMVTGQRRQSISEAQFKEPSEIGDDGAMWVDGDWLCIHQGKGGNRLRIPLSLRLDALGWSVGEVVRKCRDRTISKYMIHHGPEHTRRLKTNQVYIDTITKAFARCRDASGLDWSGKEPPTFHEIRSLSERLYKAEGRVNTQELLGHKDPRMTRVYHDPRGAEFIDVAVRG